MASSCPNNHWEAPAFHFNSSNQSVDWWAFYTRALDYLYTLDIETEKADDHSKGWKQLKIMFKGEDREALQMLIDNGTITKENMKTPCDALDAISATIKAEEHFCAHRDELLSDVRQQPNEGIHALSQCICNLITMCKFLHGQTQGMLNIMLLQHAVHFHEARDWICQQDQSELTYQSLLSHCKLLESRCKQYQKARESGWTDLTSISAATASASSIHTYALTTQACCNKSSYMHLPTGVPQMANSAMPVVA